MPLPPNSASLMVNTHQRRYDVDWLRVITLGLLIIYHVVVSFQPWATKIFFIQNEQSLPRLWVIMSIINVWRIPIVFLISGMGVRFAMERRDWKQLLRDRTARIRAPFVFGFFSICPISLYVEIKCRISHPKLQHCSLLRGRKMVLYQVRSQPGLLWEPRFLSLLRSRISCGLLPQSGP